MLSERDPSSPMETLDDIQVSIDVTSQIPPQASPNENLLPPDNLGPLLAKLKEETVGQSMANEKARLRQQSTFLDKWVSSNANNLYPSRDEKERLAAQYAMTYPQVNRWFANRRRKQTKRTKVLNSPASVVQNSACSESANSRGASPALTKTVPNIHQPEALEAFLKAALAAQQPGSSDDKMVAQNGPISETPLTPPADENQTHYSNQVVPDMSHYALNADLATLQKLLANGSPVLPTLSATGLQYPGNASNLLSFLQLSPYHQLQLLQQIQAFQAQQIAQQQLAQVLAQQAAMAAAQAQMGCQANSQPQLWAQKTAGGSISASPNHVSDSEISELSCLSPRAAPITPMKRPSSPPFKDPHNLADPGMLALMDLSYLTEKEQIAVNILMEMHTEIR